MVRPVRAIHIYYDRVAKQWFAEARNGAGDKVERAVFDSRNVARLHAKKLCDKYPSASFVK